MDETLTVAWGPVLSGDRHADAHALLQATVTSLTGVPSQEQRLGRQCGTCGGAHGGPVLEHPSLHVSLSTTPVLVVVAVTAVGPVGVDVESCAATWSSGLLTGPPTERARTWTTTEAAGKARGTGLAGPADPVGLAGTVDLTGLQLYDVPVPPGVVCTVALLSDARPALVVRGPAARRSRATGPGPPPPPGRGGPAAAAY